MKHITNSLVRTVFSFFIESTYSHPKLQRYVAIEIHYITVCRLL